MQVKVRGEWLKACGKGSTDRVFDVIKTVPTLAARGSGFEIMYQIDYDGTEWTVAMCRTIPTIDWYNK